jgi:hypothetical protein
MAALSEEKLSCYTTVKQFVGEKIKNVHELQKHNIYIFSYFFDAARDAGLIGMYLSIVYIDLPCIDCKFFLVQSLIKL